MKTMSLNKLMPDLPSNKANHLTFFRFGLQWFL